MSHQQAISFNMGIGITNKLCCGHRLYPTCHSLNLARGEHGSVVHVWSTYLSPPSHLDYLLIQVPAAPSTAIPNTTTGKKFKAF